MMAFLVRVKRFNQYVQIPHAFEGYSFTQSEVEAMLNGAILTIRTSKRDGVQVFIDRTYVTYQKETPCFHIMESHISAYDFKEGIGGSAYIPLHFLGHTFLEEELIALRAGETIMCSFLAKSGKSYYPCRVRLTRDEERNRFGFDLLTHEFSLPSYTAQNALFHPMIYDVTLTPAEVQSLRDGAFVGRDVQDVATGSFVYVVAHLVEQNGRFTVEPYDHISKVVY